MRPWPTPNVYNTYPHQHLTSHTQIHTRTRIPTVIGPFPVTWRHRVCPHARSSLQGHKHSVRTGALCVQPLPLLVGLARHVAAQLCDVEGGWVDIWHAAWAQMFKCSKFWVQQGSIGAQAQVCLQEDCRFAGNLGVARNKSDEHNAIKGAAYKL